MSNLMQIEQALLSLPQVKQGLNLTEIRRVQRTLTNAQKSKFNNTIALSKLVLQAHNWFTSDEGKVVFREEGISWTNEEFGNKVFGWQKSYFYKVLKAGKLPTEMVDTFNVKCDEAEAAGQEPNRTLEGLLKYAKQAAEQTEGSGKGEGEDSGQDEGEDNGAEVEVRTATILTFAFKAAELGMGKNVSIRVALDGTLVSSNTAEEIAFALEFLKAAVEHHGN
jgi:hypothetical protein